MTRRAPRSAAEMAIYLKHARGVHLHRVRWGAGEGWRFAFRVTDKCGTPDCFVLRVKNVREEKES